MNLESDKRLNIQLRLDFSSAPMGEARQAGREDIESHSVVNEPERPANTSRIMEEVFRFYRSDGIRRFPNTAMGSDRSGRRIRPWHRRSGTLRRVTDGCSILIWKSSSIESITTN